MLFCGTKKMLEDYRLLFASRSAFLNLWNILDFFPLTFIFILSTNYAWFCCILAWNIMLMHFNSSSNYRIIYRHSSTYAVFWDSTKPCKQKTVLLEKWFSTKTKNMTKKITLCYFENHVVENRVSKHVLRFSKADE